METYKRVNANIPVELYSKVKFILKEQDKTVTDFIIEAMKKIASEYNMMKMVDVYNKVADAACTEEGMEWEENCISDGLI